MEMNWDACVGSKASKKISPDTELASSLRKTSEKKNYSSNMLALLEETASSKISLSYDSVRELLEAISLENGYKIYNHVCYTAFLKEVLDENELAEEFDVLRVLRNDINYYGKEVSLIEAKDVLSKLNNIRKKLMKITKKQ